MAYALSGIPHTKEQTMQHHGCQYNNMNFTYLSWKEGKQKEHAVWFHLHVMSVN